MRFKITGANAESGDDVDVMLEAPSQPDVEKLAHDKGIMVASITVLEAAAKKHDSDAIALVDDAPGNGAAHAPAAPSAAPAAAHVMDPAPALNGANGQQKHEGTSTEYHVMMNQSLYLLETAVNRHLKEGWEVQGGIGLAVNNNATQYFQAVIRKHQ